MAETPLATGFKSSAADSIELVFQAPASNSVIMIAFSVVNDSGAARTYQAYIYNSSGVVIGTIAPQKIVTQDTSDEPSSAIGQIIPAGGTLRFESSDANTLTLWATGVKL
jgi:hypothetical protein